jgi:diaminopimelate decarboxylase
LCIRDVTDGISFHISNNIEIDNFNLVINRIDSLLDNFKKPNMILNIGGGYRINTNKAYFENLNKKILILKQKYNVRVIAEPGNTIVNSAGSIRTKVIGIKKHSDFHYDLFIDAGKPTGIKTDGKRIPTYINHVSEEKYCEEREYRFIDITCMYRPHFSIKLKSIVNEGDIFEFGGMGAYTICLKNDFHTWTYPSVYIS